MHDVVFRRFLGVDGIVEIVLVNGPTIDLPRVDVVFIFFFFFITERRIPRIHSSLAAYSFYWNEIWYGRKSFKTM